MTRGWRGYGFGEYDVAPYTRVWNGVTRPSRAAARRDPRRGRGRRVMDVHVLPVAHVLPVHGVVYARDASLGAAVGGGSAGTTAAAAAAAAPGTGRRTHLGEIAPR